MGALFLLIVGMTMVPARVSAATCASTLCPTDTVCRDVLNPLTTRISGTCFDTAVYPPTGNEENCINGQPLWVVNSSEGYSELACGRVIGATSSGRATCPGAYTCVSSSNDDHALCCPGLSAENVGQCPVPDVGSFGICADTCQTDSDCQTDLKCCRNACGALTCQSPVTALSPVGVTALSPVGVSAATCETTACPTTMICVDAAEGPQCVPPIKKGGCPSRRFLFRFQRCSDDCSSDGDCPGFQKCCPAIRPYACGGACSEPQPALTCENMACPTGQTCVMRQVQCVSQPCFPVPECVNAR